MKFSTESKITILLFSLLKMTLHIMADSHSGFQGDELLHIETGKHLAFGYMEFPPVIGLLAYVQNVPQSHSVFVHHIFPHLAMLAILVFVAKTTLALGGSTRAIFLVLLCVLIAPGFGRSQQLFQPVVFSQLFWAWSFYHLVRYVKYLEKNHLWHLTFTLALGFMTKYDAVFFIFGLSSLLLFKVTRQALVKHQFWWNILVFFLFISPNIIWQSVHGFPVFDMFSRLYETQLDDLTPVGVLGGLLVSLNPLTLLVSIPAFIGMFHGSMKKYRPLSVSIVLSGLALSLAQGKGYYFYPIILTLWPFGGVFWENLMLRDRKWLVYPTAIVLSLGIALIPFGMPVFSLDNYIKHDYPYEKKEIAGGRYAIRFEERYSSIKWAGTMHMLQSVYDSLPPPARKNCMIWGKHYGQAGAVNLFGGHYGLPKAFSLHGSFYNWAPAGTMPETVIALRYGKESGRRFFEPFFEEVQPAGSIYNPYAAEEEQLWQTIFICKRPKQDFGALKGLFINRIYE